MDTGNGIIRQPPLNAEVADRLLLRPCINAQGQQRQKQVYNASTWISIDHFFAL